MPLPKAENFHPTTWWILGLLLALTASMSTDPMLMVSICLINVTLILIFRGESNWAQSLNFYLALATIVIVTRVVFRVIFNFSDPSAPAVLQLPAIELNLGFGMKSSLLGRVSAQALFSALTDGFRLAAIILSVASANTLANPRKLLKATPGALYEVATAVVIAINLAPQLIASLLRVRQARQLRGRSKGLSSLASIVTPALEDTIDSSLALAASMDTRGFGRKGQVSSTTIAISRTATALALLAAVLGIFFLLSGSGNWLAALAFLITIGATSISLRATSKQGLRSRFRVIKFQGKDLAVISFGIATLALSMALGA